VGRDVLIDSLAESGYQRLLAGDPDEAADIVDDYLATHPLAAAYDAVVLPALHQAKRDRQRGRISAEDEHPILEAAREIVEELATERNAPAGPEIQQGSAEAAGAALGRVRVLACPARDEAERWRCSCCVTCSIPRDGRMHIASPPQLVSEVVALVEQQEPAVVRIGALPSGGLASHTRHLCKRLRARFPDLQIVVGRWGFKGAADDAWALVLAAGADFVGTTLGETRDQIQNVSRRAARTRPDGAPSAAPLTPEPVA
jgi:hypothetical protein